MTIRPKILVFASGSATGGGSGFETLAMAARSGVLAAEIVGVVSNHAQGGVQDKAARLKIPFIYFPAPWKAERYAEIAREYRADFMALSGWLKLVSGLDPARTVNIHPAPLPRFGGPGMYGLKLHASVLEAFRKGEIARSEICMHFVTADYDRGPVFFRHPVEIKTDDTPETLGERVKAAEHRHQPEALNLVVTGAIRWNGKDSVRQITATEM